MSTWATVDGIHVQAGLWVESRKSPQATGLRNVAATQVLARFLIAGPWAPIALRRLSSANP